MADLSLRLPIEDTADHDSSRSESPVVRSALWAAWGDALGFPVELAREPRDLQNRFGAQEVSEPVAWRRRVGGRFGPDVKLPAGAYSDDTQLRTAVSRCIRSGGRFDVEAFSKVELPIFLTYELGAGRATRRAAQGFTKRATRWSSNFFEDRVARYVSAGGNGAAMRIQPHVWAARDHRAEAYLPGLLRDAVCTHGHPRGILGAAWHALALGAALRDRHVPAPRTWLEMARSLGHIPARMETDEALCSAGSRVGRRSPESSSSTFVVVPSPSVRNWRARRFAQLQETAMWLSDMRSWPTTSALFAPRRVGRELLAQSWHSGSPGSAKTGRSTRCA